MSSYNIRLIIYAFWFLIPSNLIAQIDISLPEIDSTYTNQEIQVPITISDATDLEVFSFYSQIIFNPSVLEYNGVNSENTLSNSWGNTIANLSSPGEVSPSSHAPSTSGGHTSVGHP